MRSARIIGVDPGARSTGICVITTDRTYVTHTTVVSDAVEFFPASRDYLSAVLLGAQDLILEHDPEVIAVEAINRPNWHMKGRAAADPRALLATAEVLGAIKSHHWPRATVASIPPSRNGSRQLGTYPPILVSASESRKPNWQSRIGHGKLRHARSAYDVACAGIEYTIRER